LPHKTYLPPLDIYNFILFSFMFISPVQSIQSNLGILSVSFLLESKTSKEEQIKMSLREKRGNLILFCFGFSHSVISFQFFKGNGPVFLFSRYKIRNNKHSEL